MVFDVKAQKIAAKGQCIAHLPPESGRGGKTVFIQGAIPGEALKVIITAEKKDWAAARIVEVVEPSPHRVAPACNWQPVCGGCDFSHIEGAQQVELKKQILIDCLRRQGVEHTGVEVVFGQQTHYRCRFRLHDGCFMKRTSHDKAGITSCLVATQQMNEYLAAVSPKDRPSGSCVVFASSLLTPRPLATTEAGRLAQVVVQSERDEDNKATVNLLGKRITFDVRGFFQSNMELLEKTVPLVVQGLEGMRAVDLYAGVGTFAVFLADRFDEVCVVERDERAAGFAKVNLAGKKARVYGESAALWCSRQSKTGGKRRGGFDAAVVDPPRGGMDKATVRWLCSSGVNNIRSLSCDPATHARDLKLLTSAGYKMTRLVLLDFLPQTSHVESLAYLKR